MNVDHLRELTDQFLAHDLPKSFLMVGCPPYEVEVGTEKSLIDVSEVKVETGFYRGNCLANYRLLALNAEIRLNVMLNVRKMVVSYKLSLDYQDNVEAVQTAFAFALDGARHSGFEINWLDQRVPGQDPATELRAFLMLDRTFLGDAGETLFWANDLALMTRAVLRCMQRYDRDRLELAVA